MYPYVLILHWTQALSQNGPLLALASTFYHFFQGESDHLEPFPFVNLSSCHRWRGLRRSPNKLQPWERRLQVGCWKVPRGSFFRSPFFISLNIAMIGHRNWYEKQNQTLKSHTFTSSSTINKMCHVQNLQNHHHHVQNLLNMSESQAAPWAPCPLAWAARCHRW